MTPTTNSNTAQNITGASRRRWGDQSDSDDDEEVLLKPSTLENLVVPPTHTSRVDSTTGTRTVTSYRSSTADPSRGRLLKTVTKQAVNVTQNREHVGIEQRRHWKKFGDAIHDTTNVTIHSKDEVVGPWVDDKQEKGEEEDDSSTQDKALTVSFRSFQIKQERRKLERLYGVDTVEGTRVGTSGTSSGTAMPDSYVPPHRRRGSTTTTSSAASLDDGLDRNVIRVSNVSSETTEDDLDKLFSPFGRIRRIHMAREERSGRFKGFAFVHYVVRVDAARALERLQGHAHDYMILHLEYARSRTADSSRTEYRSGYGQALAQETNERVTYASNLTR